MRASLVGVLLGFVLAGCDEETLGELSPAGAEESVRVVVEGEGRATVTWGNVGSTSQDTVRLPWEETIETDEIDFVSLVAQRESDGPGRIECRIEREDGTVIESATARGAFA